MQQPDTTARIASPAAPSGSLRAAPPRRRPVFKAAKKYRGAVTGTSSRGHETESSSLSSSYTSSSSGEDGEDRLQLEMQEALRMLGGSESAPPASSRKASRTPARSVGISMVLVLKRIVWLSFALFVFCVVVGLYNQQQRKTEDAAANAHHLQQHHHHQHDTRHQAQRQQHTFMRHEHNTASLSSRTPHHHQPRPEFDIDHQKRLIKQMRRKRKLRNEMRKQRNQINDLQIESKNERNLHTAAARQHDTDEDQYYHDLFNTALDDPDDFKHDSDEQHAAETQDKLDHPDLLVTLVKATQHKPLSVLKRLYERRHSHKHEEHKPSDEQSSDTRPPAQDTTGLTAANTALTTAHSCSAAATHCTPEPATQAADNALSLGHNQLRPSAAHQAVQHTATHLLTADDEPHTIPRKDPERAAEHDWTDMDDHLFAHEEGVWIDIPAQALAGEEEWIDVEQPEDDDEVEWIVIRESEHTAEHNSIESNEEDRASKTMKPALAGEENWTDLEQLEDPDEIEWTVIRESEQTAEHNSFESDESTLKEEDWIDVEQLEDHDEVEWTVIGESEHNAEHNSFESHEQDKTLAGDGTWFDSDGLVENGNLTTDIQELARVEDRTQVRKDALVVENSRTEAYVSVHDGQGDWSEANDPLFAEHGSWDDAGGMTRLEDCIEVDESAPAAADSGIGHQDSVHDRTWREAEGRVEDGSWSDIRECARAAEDNSTAVDEYLHDVEQWPENDDSGPTKEESGTKIKAVIPEGEGIKSDVEEVEPVEEGEWTGSEEPVPDEDGERIIDEKSVTIEKEHERTLVDLSAEPSTLAKNTMMLVTEAVHEIVTRSVRGARKVVRLGARISTELVTRTAKGGRKVGRLIPKGVSEIANRSVRTAIKSVRMVIKGISEILTRIVRGARKTMRLVTKATAKVINFTENKQPVDNEDVEIIVDEKALTIEKENERTLANLTTEPSTAANKTTMLVTEAVH